MNPTSSFHRLSWAFGTLRSAAPRASSSRQIPRPSRRTLSTRPRAQTPADLQKNNPFYVPPPGPDDIPPISARLKPLIPFFLYWTALTSLAFHLMQVRTHTKEELSRKEAQLTVLENLVERYKNAAGASGDNSRTIVDEEEVDRELRMVGLRERLKPTSTGTEEGMERLEEEFVEGRTIGWKEVFFGRKSTKLSEEEQESAAKAEWQQVLNAASTHSNPPSSSNTPKRDYSGLDSKMPEIPTSSASSTTTTTTITEGARRAPSSAVYM
ncbi:hypothetical protein HD553DRAFT_303790 [Filobasidium floriforme]|uniref:uncharacterized protein n=1 Tax=Filobasidium floriforme TaxID=5210 RepID=UPI001E8D5D69|nr:uncharacterized protein HD553DRAFT_303790 [Filobasidium floriforme]KAH8090956.1 hypothetical protein HD553DRAFT_303790 [Filobasidium floriforme]